MPNDLTTRRVLGLGPVARRRLACAGQLGTSGVALAVAGSLAASTALMRTFVLPGALGLFTGALVVNAIRQLRGPVEQRPMLSQVIPSLLMPVIVFAGSGRTFLAFSAPSAWLAIAGGALLVGGLASLQRLLAPEPSRPDDAAPPTLR